MRLLIAALSASLVAVLVAGCATPPPPVKLAKTTVVLLPDEDGNVGAVLVGNGDGDKSNLQRIDQAYATASVEGVRGGPSAVTSMGRERVDRDYATLLSAQPPKPKTFILHFVIDKTVLTAESKAMLPAVLEAIRERKPTEITIFGHADATGTEKRNNKLSADRAKMVADLLRKIDPTLDRIDVQYFGDRAPLVPSDGRVPEPRNRRAEVMVL